MLQFTKRELDKLTSERLAGLINYAGSETHLARMLGVSQQHVHSWKKRGRISKRGVLRVRENEAFPAYFKQVGFLRPDWFEVV